MIPAPTTNSAIGCDSTRVGEPGRHLRMPLIDRIILNEMFAPITIVNETPAGTACWPNLCVGAGDKHKQT